MTSYINDDLTAQRAGDMMRRQTSSPFTSRAQHGQSHR
jgi:hypothetical protein